VRQFATNGLFQDFVNVGNMVDENIFNTENRINSHLYEIITVGAYTPVKDQITMLNALKLIDYPLNKKIRFTWVGINGWGGEFENEVKKIIEDYNFFNIEIVLIKYATSNEIAKFLKQSDLFLTSSLCETFGVSVLESLACGVPVITTQSGGINEMITLENGRIIRIKDSEAMANQIKNIMKGKLIFDKKTISKHIIEKYGLEYFKTKMSLIYKLAMGINDC
jgi:glycosyltransferase involved in cell wall biosynthesis